MIPTKQLKNAALVLAILLSACTSKPFLKVQYQLPPKTNSMAEEKVFLAVKDLRENDILLSPTAKKSIKNFDESFSLVVVKPDGSGNLLGAYDLNALLIEIFKQRLEHFGLRVTQTTETTTPVPTIEIELKQLKLDLVKRKWIVKMNYQASLIKDGNPLAKESVEGTAERLKVMGKDDAEKILGELVSDMVNKLDLAKLLQNAYR